MRNDLTLTGAQAVFKWSQQTPDALAICDDAVSYSYASMVKHIANMVYALQERGLHKGMLVGIKCSDRYLGLILVLACEVIGVTQAHVPMGEFIDQKILGHCAAFCIDDNIVNELVCDVVVWLDQVLKDKIIQNDISIDKIKIINHVSNDSDELFLDGTSGTTGGKKFFLDRRVGRRESTRHMLEQYFPEGVKNFICSYFMHTGAGYVGCMAALNCGGTIIFSKTRDFLDAVQKYPNSHGVFILRDGYKLMRESLVLGELNKISSVRVLGAFLPEDLRLWLEKNVAHRVSNSYSSNEAGQISEVQSNGVGRLFPGVNVKIVDDNRASLAYGEHGLIAVQSAQNIFGYLWDEALTKKHFEDGWFFSSDRGYMSDANTLVVLGRNDNMINVGGLKIAPEPIEQMIKSVEGINDCVLFYGDVPYDPQAVIVCVERHVHEKHDEIAQAITNVFDGVFHSFLIMYIDAFPRTETGKVQRHVLRQDVLLQI